MQNNDLTGPFVIFLPIIFMPAGNLLFFGFLFLFVNIFGGVRMCRYRFLILILGVFGHDHLLKSYASFTSDPTLTE